MNIVTLGSGNTDDIDAIDKAKRGQRGRSMAGERNARRRKRNLVLAFQDVVIPPLLTEEAAEPRPKL